jgi:hypothetical protein
MLSSSSSVGGSYAAAVLASGWRSCHVFPIFLHGAGDLGLGSVIQPVAQTMIPTGDLALGSVVLNMPAAIVPGWVGGRKEEV